MCTVMFVNRMRHSNQQLTHLTDRCQAMSYVPVNVVTSWTASTSWPSGWAVVSGVHHTITSRCFGSVSYLSAALNLNWHRANCGNHISRDGRRVSSGSGFRPGFIRCTGYQHIQVFSASL